MKPEAELKAREIAAESVRLYIAEIESKAKMSAVKPGESLPLASVNPVEAVALAKPQQGKMSEKKIADVIFQEYGGNLVRQEDSMFRYTNTHWVEVGPTEIDRMKNRINDLCGDCLKSKDVNSIFNTFRRYVTPVPEVVNLFVPNPFCANFLDGTLHLERDLATGKYTKVFRPHSREDYITWCIPLKYQVDRSIKNELLERLLEEVFQGDADKAGKIRAIKQAGGAMLIPAFPQLVFFHGPSGSRKSTIAKCFSKVLHPQNLSFVDPTAMEGFQIEGMIGKLVNINTDIEDHVPLPRGFIKRFEDRMPFQVNRKNKPVVNTVLPALHLYCANRLPPNFEGPTKSLQRRVTLVAFPKDLTNDNRKDEIKYYEELIYNRSPEGVLNFMVEGLDDLIANGGKFTPPVSSETMLEDWQKLNDPVGMFLDDIKNPRNGSGVVADDEIVNGDRHKTERGKLYDAFGLWADGAGVRIDKFHRKAFFKSLRDRGIEDYESHDGYVFPGFRENPLGALLPSGARRT